MFKIYKFFDCSIRFFYDSNESDNKLVTAPYQHVIVDAAIKGSIPTRGNELFSFPRSGNETNSGVKFRLSIRNVSKIRQRVRNSFYFSSLKSVNIVNFFSTKMSIFHKIHEKIY